MPHYRYITHACKLSFNWHLFNTQGYHKRCAFIATQAPLPDTVDDFWRMVWEKQSATIVILTHEREGGKVKCHRYWPSTGAANYGSLQVILHAVSEYPDYTLRELKIIDLRVSFLTAGRCRIYRSLK